MDGSKPKTTPISVENPTDTTMDVPLIATGVEDILEMTSASPIPAATPKSPPILVRIAASVKNCPRILPFLAPIAFFKPISFVRSVTETSMIFMTPIPPTRREMQATQINMLLVELCISCSCFACCIRSSERYVILESDTFMFWFIIFAAAFPAAAISSAPLACKTRFCASSNL